VSGLLELRADAGDVPRRGLFEGRVEQAYVRYADGSGTFGLQLGQFASPFGPYAGQFLTPEDPFVRPPLPYDYRTIMSRSIVAANPFAFSTWRNAQSFFRPSGAPPVWSVPYPWGAMAMGAWRAVSYRVAAVNSAPSSEPADWRFSADRMKHPSWIGALRVALSPAVAVEGSYDTGPYLDAITSGSLPAGRSRWDYRQEIWSANLTYARGPVVARTEFLHDRWEVPRVGDDLVERGYIATLQSDVAAGLFAALRWSYLDFRPWNDVAGTNWEDWDADVARAEASVGYRIATNVGVLASALADRQRTAGARTQRLLAVRWWWAF
jgi:hypothetical protein